MAEIGNSELSQPKQLNTSAGDTGNTEIPDIAKALNLFSKGQDSQQKSNEEKENASSKSILTLLSNIKTALVNFINSFKQKNKNEKQSLEKILKELSEISKVLEPKKKNQKKQINISNDSIKSFVETLKTQIFAQLLDKTKTINENLQNFVSSSNSNYVEQYSSLLKQYIKKISEFDLQNPTLLDNLKNAVTQSENTNNKNFLDTLTNLNKYFENANSDKQFLNQNLEAIQSKIDSDIKPLIAEQAASKSETKTTTQTVKKLLQQVQTTSEKSGIEKTEIDTAINESKQQSKAESQDKKKIDDSIKSLTLKNGKAGADISTQKNAQNISKIQTKVLPFVKALYTTPEIKKTNETILGQKNSTVGIQKLIKHYFKEWDDRDLNKDKFDSDLDGNTTQGIDDDETGEGALSKRGFLSSMLGGSKKLLKKIGGTKIGGVSIGGLLKTLGIGAGALYGIRWANSINNNGFWGGLKTMWNDTFGKIGGGNNSDNSNSQIEYNAPIDIQINSDLAEQLLVDHEKAREPLYAALAKLSDEEIASAKSDQTKSAQADSDQLTEFQDLTDINDSTIDSIDTEQARVQSITKKKKDQNGQQQDTTVEQRISTFNYDGNNPDAVKNLSDQMGFKQQSQKTEIDSFLKNPKLSKDTNLDAIAAYVSIVRRAAGEYRIKKTQNGYQLYKLQDFNNLIDKDKIKQILRENESLTNLLLHINYTQLDKLTKILDEIIAKNEKSTNTKEYQKSIILHANKLPTILKVWVIPKFYDWLRWLNSGSPKEGQTLKTVKADENTAKAIKNALEVNTLATKIATAGQKVVGERDADANIQLTSDNFFIKDGSLTEQNNFQDKIIEIYKTEIPTILDSIFNSAKTTYKCNINDTNLGKIKDPKNFKITYLTQLFTLLITNISNYIQPTQNNIIKIQIFIISQCAIKIKEKLLQYANGSKNVEFKRLLIDICERLSLIYDKFNALLASYGTVKNDSSLSGNNYVQIEKDLDILTDKFKETGTTATFNNTTFTIAGKQTEAGLKIQQTLTNYITAYQTANDGNLPSLDNILELVTNMYGRKLTDQQVQAILKFLQLQEFQIKEKDKQGKPIKKKIDLGANNDKTIFQSSLNEKLGTANRATSINDFKATIMGSDSGFNTISVNPKANTAQDILDTIASQTLSSNPSLPSTNGSTVSGITPKQLQKDAAGIENTGQSTTDDKIHPQPGDSSTSTKTGSNIPGTPSHTGDGKLQPQPPELTPKNATGVTPPSTRTIKRKFGIWQWKERIYRSTNCQWTGHYCTT